MAAQESGDTSAGRRLLVSDRAKLHVCRGLRSTSLQLHRENADNTNRIHAFMRRLASLLALVVLWTAAPAWAQSFRPPDPLARPWGTAQINLGPIYFAPTFELKDVGIDNNVFNEDTNQKNDLTGALGMRSLAGLHFGESLVFQVTQANSYIYYRRYRSERSVDGGLNFLLEFRTRAVRPWIRWDKLKTSQRTGVEIDARAERKTPNFDFGVDFTTALRLGVSFAARRSLVRYKDTVTERGVNLSEALDSSSDSYQGFLRYELTDLSDIVFGADYLRDRFTKSPIRDNDSFYYYAGIRTKQGATFVGSATVGFRQQKHNDPAVPNFKGVTANVEVAVVPNEFLKLELSGGRDLGYSYQEQYPYFVQQGAGGTLTNRFAEHLDVVLSAKGTWLNYSDTIAGGKDPRMDRTMVLGLGAGYFVGGGNGTRLGIVFEHAQRVSPITARNYVTNRVSTNYRFSF